MKLNRAFWSMISGSSACIILATFGFRESISEDSVSNGWLLFSFAMLVLGSFGYALTLVAMPVKDQVVSVPARIILFGVTSGLLWSLAPGGLADQFHLAGTPQVLIASAFTGVVVSSILYKPLIQSGRLGALLLGITALPLGAFCFGVCESVISLTRGLHTGTGLLPGEMPFELGVQYAVLSVISVFAVIFIPLAILTTFFLRAVISPKQLQLPHTEATKQ